MNRACFRTVALFLAAGLTWALAAPVLHAQSLADLARKEEERRKAIQQAAKVYTNKDLGPVAPAPPATAPAAAPAAAGDAKPSATDTKDAAAKPEPEPAGEKKDQAYWAGRLKALQQQLDRDQSFADALQVKINALTTDFVNRDDPAQRRLIETNRAKALTDLAQLKKAVADDNKAIAALTEEARRSGVPPGWLR